MTYLSDIASHLFLGASIANNLSIGIYDLFFDSRRLHTLSNVQQQIGNRYCVTHGRNTSVRSSAANKPPGMFQPTLIFEIAFITTYYYPTFRNAKKGKPFRKEYNVKISSLCLRVAR